jgi:UDP-N-acetylglucosamine 1-carboxyvinyltransferase
MQPFFTLLGMKAQGRSRILDYRYPERIAYAAELDRFCPGSVKGEVGRITTNGVANLRGCEVRSTDLRGSMAVVMAGFNAEGETIVRDVQMALRGYNNLMGKLNGLGLRAELIS